MRVARRTSVAVAGGLLLVMAGAGVASADTAPSATVPGADSSPTTTLSCQSGVSFPLPKALSPNLIAFIAQLIGCAVNNGSDGGSASGGGS